MTSVATDPFEPGNFFRHFAEARGIFQHFDGGRYHAEDRDQNTVSLDTANHTNEPVSGVFDVSNPIRVVFRNSKRIEHFAHFFLAPTPLLASGEHHTTVARRSLNLVFDSPLTFRDQITFRSGVASETHCSKIEQFRLNVSFPVLRNEGGASCRANHNSASRCGPSPIGEQVFKSVHLRFQFVDSEQLFSRSGRSSRRSTSPSAPAARNARPTSTSKASATRRLPHFWPSFTKFADVAALKRRMSR